MLGLRVLLWQSDGLEEKALLPQYLVHGNDGPTSQTDFFVDSLLGVFLMSPLPSMLSEEVQTVGSLRSTSIPPLHHYYGPFRHPLIFGRFPGVSGYTTSLAPPF